MGSTNTFSKVFTTKKSRDNKHYFVIMGRSEPIGQSETYESPQNRDKGIASVCTRVILYALRHPNIKFFNLVWAKVFKYMPKEEIIKALNLVVPEVTINKHAKKG